MIVVTGGNGLLGREIVKALQELIGNSFVVSVRDPEKAADLAAQGLEVRGGDFDKPDDIARAVEGAETVLVMTTLSPQDVRIKQYRTATDAAKRAGVKHLALTGYLADQPDSPFPSALSIREGLAYMRAQGFRPINLRNGNYAEAGLATAQRAVAAGRLAAPAGNGKVSYVTRRDLARATAQILVDADRYAGADLALSGPAAYGHAELAALVSQAAGQEIPYVDLTPEEYAAELAKAGTPAGFIAFMQASAETVKRGLLAEVSDTISEITGTPPEDGLAFIRRELAK